MVNQSHGGRDEGNWNQDRAFGRRPIRVWNNWIDRAAERSRLSYRIMNSAVTISIPAAAARQADEPVRRSSCAVIRYYVAKYSAPAAEAWARSQGATEAEIQIARRCVKPQQTVLLGRAAA